MTRNVFDPSFDQLPKAIPVFPLDGALLLPGGRLPLNIFEPRYLNMVRDALAADRQIGMVQTRPDTGDGEQPEIYGTGCSGRIVAFSETDDGRYLITLAGLIRFDVLDELPLQSGYRRVVPDFGRYRDDLDEDPAEIRRAPLLDALKDYFGTTGIEGDWEAIEQTTDEQLVTALAMSCPFQPSEKQALLEAMTLPERAETITAILRMAVHRDGDVSTAH